DYTTPNPLRTRVSRFTRSATSPPAADPDSEVILFEVEQPYTNHNAGAIAFGPPEGPGGERYLYVTLGDGGLGGDPHDNGQNPASAPSAGSASTAAGSPSTAPPAPARLPSRRTTRSSGSPTPATRSGPTASGTPGGCGSTKPATGRCGSATWGRARGRRSTS